MPTFPKFDAIKPIFLAVNIDILKSKLFFWVKINSSN